MKQPKWKQPLTKAERDHLAAHLITSQAKFQRALDNMATNRCWCDECHAIGKKIGMAGNLVEELAWPGSEMANRFMLKRQIQTAEWRGESEHFEINGVKMLFRLNRRTHEMTLKVNGEFNAASLDRQLMIDHGILIAEKRGVAV